MDIAAMSIGLSQMKLATEVNTSVMKLAMDTSVDQMDDMMRVMEQSVNPHIGSSIDLSL